MKITKEQLKQIVEEEIDKILNEDWYEPHIWPDEMKWPGGSEVMRKQKAKKIDNREKPQWKLQKKN